MRRSLPPRPAAGPGDRGVGAANGGQPNVSASRADALADLAAAVRACRRCPTMSPERQRVPGFGAAGGGLFFLAEAPGRFGAARTGIPFRGDRSGDLFWSLVAAYNLRDFYVTNVVKCNPLDPRGRNRAPSAAERACCRPHWRAEVAAVRPRWLVPLGDTACREVTGRPLRACVNRRVDTALGPAWTLYHPAYITRGSYALGAYRDDWLALLAAARDGEGGQRLPPGPDVAHAPEPQRSGHVDEEDHDKGRSHAVQHAGGAEDAAQQAVDGAGHGH
jgi:uracil-DNA glycosylase family 4